MSCVAVGGSAAEPEVAKLHHHGEMCIRTFSCHVKELVYMVRVPQVRVGFHLGTHLDINLNQILVFQEKTTSTATR
jgi:hypothetical protein